MPKTIRHARTHAHTKFQPSKRWSPLNVFDILISALLWRECFAAFVITYLMIIIRKIENEKNGLWIL